MSEDAERLSFGIVHLEELKVSKGPRVVNFFLPDESISKTEKKRKHWRMLSPQSDFKRRPPAHPIETAGFSP